MLILTRKRGDEILIGDDIVITFLGTGSHGEYRVGIDAPRRIPIVRAEIAHKFDHLGRLLDEDSRGNR
jgi:carbon storage regulator